MEILIGFIASGITEVIKILAKHPKIDLELSKKIVHGVVIVVCYIGVLIINKGFISWEIVESYVQMFAVAYTVYNMLIKPTKQKLLKK